MPQIYRVGRGKAALTGRVLNFIQQGPFYFALGKPTPWNIEDSPPVIPDDLLTIPDPFIYKRVYKVLPAIQSDCGELKMYTQSGWTSWHTFDIDSITREGSGYLYYPTHVYISLEINDQDYQATSYRCVGLHSHVQLSLDANPNELVYPPSFVSPGVLEWVCFHTPVFKQGIPRTLDFLIEV